MDETSSTAKVLISFGKRGDLENVQFMQVTSNFLVDSTYQGKMGLR